MKQNSGLQIVEIELTNDCNLKCKHCYVDKSNFMEMSSDHVFELINELNKLMVHRIVFTGGEPLLVKKQFGEFLCL